MSALTRRFLAALACCAVLATTLSAQFMLTASRARPTLELRKAIGPTGYLWVDDGSSELVDGQAVGAWTDLMHGLVATQATGSEQPVARYNVLTGRKAIVLDGDDFLQTGLFTQALTQPTTIYVVMRDSEGPAAALRTVVTGIHTDNRHTIVVDTIWKLTSGSAAISFSAAPADALPHLVVAEFNDGSGNSNTNLYIDGVLIARPHGISGPDTLTGITIGANAAGVSNFQGEISAIVVKPGLRDVAVETELTAYLNLNNYFNNDDLVTLIAAIGWDGYLWVDDGSELVDTESVSTWTDRIHGLAATQATGSKQPVAELNATTGLLDVVTVRGPGQSLQTLPFATELNQPTTVYTVLELNYADGNKHLQRNVFDGNESGKGHSLTTQGTIWKMRSGANQDFSAFTEDVIQMMTAEFNQPGSKLYIDAVDTGFSRDTGTETFSGLTIASNAGQGGVYWDGKLSALVIRPGVRDAAVEVALNDYLGNPVTLP